MDGHHPDTVGVQNSAYRFTCPKFFPGYIWQRIRVRLKPCPRGHPRENKGENDISAAIDRFVKPEPGA